MPTDINPTELIELLTVILPNPKIMAIVMGLILGLPIASKLFIKKVLPYLNNLDPWGLKLSSLPNRPLIQINGLQTCKVFKIYKAHYFFQYYSIIREKGEYLPNEISLSLFWINLWIEW